MKCSVVFVHWARIKTVVNIDCDDTLRCMMLIATLHKQKQINVLPKVIHKQKLEGAHQGGRAQLPPPETKMKQ